MVLLALVAVWAFLVAAVYTYRLPNGWRWPWAVALVVAGLGALVLDRNFTDGGHLVALAIGFACYPLTTAKAPRLRAAGPIWSPSPRPAGTEVIR